MEKQLNDDDSLGYVLNSAGALPILTLWANGCVKGITKWEPNLPLRILLLER